jgi:multidrug efflux system membrane fusion protein
MKLSNIAIPGLTILLMVLLSCSDDKKNVEEAIRPVAYQQVLSSGSNQSRTFSGTSKAATEAKLSFRVGGTLNFLNVKVGDRLRKGALIASVDDTDAQLTYDKALVALEKTRIQKETAKSTLDRVKGLFENNNVSLQDYETAKTNYATANAAYNADKKNVDLQKRNLSYFKIYAPINGIVTTVNVAKNENVNPGAIVAIMNAGEGIEVNVGVPESIISKTKKGGSVSVTFAAVPDKVFDGIITEVAYTSSGSTTYPVTVKLTAPTSDIRPGMSADVSFVFAREQNNQAPFIIAPVAGVGEDTRSNFVFVLKKEENDIYRVEKRAITVGELLPEGFAVTSGLSENELIATAGLNTLMDGMQVRLLNK